MCTKKLAVRWSLLKLGDGCVEVYYYHSVQLCPSEMFCCRKFESKDKAGETTGTQQVLS